MVVDKRKKTNMFPFFTPTWRNHPIWQSFVSSRWLNHQCQWVNGWSDPGRWTCCKVETTNDQPNITATKLTFQVSGVVDGSWRMVGYGRLRYEVKWSLYTYRESTSNSTHKRRRLVVLTSSVWKTCFFSFSSFATNNRRKNNICSFLFWGVLGATWSSRLWMEANNSAAFSRIQAPVLPWGVF